MEITKRNKRKRLRVFILLAVLLAAIFIISSLINPEEIIDSIGERNGYFAAFGIAFFAGFSALTALSFYSALIAFISGGLNPILLAVIMGFSLSLGDLFLFWFGRRGREFISGRLDRSITRLAEYFREKKLEKYIPVFAWVYMGFIPLPNDWLLIFLASIRFPLKKMVYLIPLGDLTHAGFVTFLASRGISFFS